MSAIYPPRILAWLLFPVILVTAGCQPSPPNGTAGGGVNSPGTVVANRSPTTAPSNAAPSKEYWDVLFFEKSKVGYAHTVYETTQEQGRNLVRITATSELSMQRYGQTIQQTISYSSVESPDGEVIRCESRMTNGSSATGAVEIETKAQARNNKLAVEMITLGKQLTSELPWDPSWGGFFA